MSVKSFELQARVPAVLAGFEDGSVVLWDMRHTGKEVASVKLFSEPGARISMACFSNTLTTRDDTS